MPVLPIADIDKFLELSAPYTSARLVEHIAKLHNQSVLIEGLEVREIPGNPAQIFIHPGKALIRGIVVEMLTQQTLSKPAFALPYVVFINTVDEDDASDTTLDFAVDANSIPPGAVVLAEFTTSDTIVSAKKETLDGRTRGVKARRVLRSGGGTVFPLEGLHFSPVTDELFAFASGTKIELDPAFGATLNGLREITLPNPLGEGLLLDLLAHSAIRFREIQTGVLGDIIATDLDHPYDTEISDLLVFKNGELLTPGVDYDQSGANQVNVFVDSIATDRWEVFGVDGLIHRETFNLVAETDVDFDFHGYRPGTQGLWVFAGKLKLVPTFDYVEESAEKIVLTQAFTGVVDVLSFHSLISPTDVNRELGEFFDLGRDLADAIVDPDGNRPSLSPPTADNPFATVLDVTTNQEVVDARGTFLTLNDRITAAVDASGVLIPHGGLHVESGSDPVPNAVGLPTPVGGLHSAVDKAAWDAHLGARGEDEHAIALADPPTSGFISGSDQAKLDAINPLLIPKGVWGIQFYDDPSPAATDPATLGNQVKSSLVFRYPTLDGTVAAFQPTNSEPFSYTIRFTMTVDVDSPETIFISMLSVLVGRGRVYVNGTEQAIPVVGSGRAEGSFALPAAAGTRIDVVFSKSGSGTIAGTRASMHTDLLAPSKDISFVSAP